MMKKIILLFLLFALKCLAARGNTDTLVIDEDDIKLINKKYFTELEDPHNNLGIDYVIRHGNFVNSPSSLPQLKMSNSVIWIKLILHNETSEPFIPISIVASVIDHFDLYSVSANSNKIVHVAAERPKTDDNISPSINLINCPILPDSTRTVYLRVESNVPNIIPIQFHGANKYLQHFVVQNIIFGLFMGVVGIMILYNLMLYFIVKDKSYLYYVCYILFLGITQSTVRGYGQTLIDHAFLNNYFTPLCRTLFWLSILLFVQEFLQIRRHQKSMFRYYRLLYVLFLVPIVLVLNGNLQVAFTILTFSSVISAVALLFTGALLYFNGYKPAKFFMIAWGLFFISVFFSIARNKGYVAYNDFTSNVLLYSSALEIVLFSIALADKINFYRDQNNESQFVALRIARENERLITEQNIGLETRVLARTKELLESNANLTGLVQNLRAAQAQLIETEKMASLGQLTAGIAHEINNPINFVKSNVKPLKLDFNDIFQLLDTYAAIEAKSENKELFKAAADFKQSIDLEFVKTEINDLLNGIEEGASRTAEIVQSLRTFSRTDEVELKPADINKSILSTLILLRSTIPYYIEITPVFDKLSLINCYPGKLNQVFMNLIQNSIQAITEKTSHVKESIAIMTADHPDSISIQITDTGNGMTDAVKQKIFDPFFTTKDVGEGTGLGLSIVFGIIEKHRGTIDVQSELGKGTTITVTVPKTLV